MSDLTLYRHLLALDYEMRACIENARCECIMDGVDPDAALRNMLMARAVVLSVLDEYQARCEEQRREAERAHPGIVSVRDIEADIWRLYYGSDAT